MLALAREHRDTLVRHNLVPTGTTGGRLSDELGLDVRKMLSGPQGGDAQIAALAAEGHVHGVIFLVDPLFAHPHEPDVQGLQRICNVHNVPLATNSATARLLLAHLSTR